jgi:hypothetical protein
MRGAKKNKHAQVKLSFGMIFSVILIIAFLAFAFYAIRGFLNLQEDIGIRQFKDKLRSDINKLTESQRGGDLFEYGVSDEIEALCIVNSETTNIIIKFKDGTDDWMNIEKLDAEASIKPRKEFCIPAIDGKIKLQLEKAWGENFVTIDITSSRQLNN